MLTTRSTQSSLSVLTGKNQRTNSRSAEQSSCSIFWLPLRYGEVFKWVCGHDKDGRLVDKKAIIRIVDAGLQKGSSKFGAVLASQTWKSCEQGLCAAATALWWTLVELFQWSREKANWIQGGIDWYYWCEVLLPEQERTVASLLLKNHIVAVLADRKPLILLVVLSL